MKKTNGCVSCAACAADNLNGRAKYAVLVSGGILFMLGLLPLYKDIRFFLFFAAYLLSGSGVLFKALKNLFKGNIFDENFLMSIATAGAFAIGEYSEGVAVMLFYQVGELLQDISVGRSRKSISDLMDIRPDYANLKTESGVRRVDPRDVKVGDVIVVKAGEKIPLNGIVLAGTASVDLSALTGESMPRDIIPESEVLSGSFNLDGVLTIQVTKPFGQSAVSKILDLVEKAVDKKAKAEKFITKFARVYTPAVVAAALALAFIPPLLTSGDDFGQWVNRSLIFLVVSCPCALVISIPLGYFAGIGGGSRNGILFKGSDSLDTLSNIKTVVFDKTGTLTRGVFEVADIVPSFDFTKNKLLELAAYVESGSNHPIARSVQKAFAGQTDPGRIAGQKEIAGLGVSAVVDGLSVLAGNSRLMEQNNISVPDIKTPGTVLYVAADGVCAGYILIEDRLKPDSPRAVGRLKELGVETIAMLTGDSLAAAQKAANQAGIDLVYAGLLPHQKVEKLEGLIGQTGSAGALAFVGDGINDAPVLARADIGVAMGGLGSDSAIEAADVVLMSDEPYKLTTAILIAKKTRRIVWQNIVFALSVKILILALSAAGLTSMWAAVFGDVGVTVLTVFNSVRAMKVRGG